MTKGERVRRDSQELLTPKSLLFFFPQVVEDPVKVPTRNSAGPFIWRRGEWFRSTAASILLPRSLAPLWRGWDSQVTRMQDVLHSTAGKQHNGIQFVSGWPPLRSKHLLETLVHHVILSTCPYLRNLVDIGHYHALGPGAYFVYSASSSERRPWVTVRARLAPARNEGRLDLGPFLRLGESGRSALPARPCGLGHRLCRNTTGGLWSKDFYVPRIGGMPARHRPCLTNPEVGLEPEHISFFFWGDCPSKRAASPLLKRMRR